MYLSLECKKFVFSSLPFPKKNRFLISQFCVYVTTFHFMMQLTYLHKTGMNVFIRGHPSTVIFYLLQSLMINGSDALVCDIGTPKEQEIESQNDI